MTYIFKLTSCYLLILAFLNACNSDDAPISPRPHAFPRVIYPKRDSLLTFDKTYCAFSFKYPRYMQFQQDTTYFDEKAKDPCWFNLYYPMFNATLHCSYYPISKINTFDKLVGDAFDMAGKHNIKADYIDELPIQKPNHVSGMVFDIQGPAASPFQFYLTDSTRHYFRGSLYFNTHSRPDSLAPVINFVKTDVIQIINSFEWN